MATVPGGIFDSSTNTNIDANQGALISSFLDSLGLSETSLTQVTVSTTGTNTIADTVSSATFAVGSGQTANVVLSGSSGTTLIVTGSGNASISGSTGGDSVLGGAGSDSVFGGTGSDSIMGGLGDDVIRGGAGNDIVSGNRLSAPTKNGTSDENDTLVGGAGNDSLSGDAGNDRLETGVDNDTVDGGSGYDVAVIAGNVDDYVATVVDGQLTLTKSGGGSVTDLTNVQFVQFDNDKAVIATADTSQAALAVLYETLFGRTADAEGLDFWINLAAAGHSFNDIAQGFVTIGGATFSNLSDAEFVELLYQNTFSRASDAEGKDYWVQALANGHTRGEIAASFANISVANFDNAEVTTVGYVKIIDGII